MKFLTDENFPDRANALLVAFDVANEVNSFKSRFARGTPDVEWLRAVVGWEEKPFIVSGDGRILTNPIERMALKASGCSYVHLLRGWTNTPWNAYAVKLLKCWPRIVENAGRTLQQSIIKVSTSGHVERHTLR